MSFEKSAAALVAENYLENLILERFLINILPTNRKYSLKTINNLTGYNFLPIKNIVNSKIFEINKKTIQITDNNNLLAEKAKIYCELIIKKLIFPSKYKYNRYIYYIGRLFDNCYYTQNENRFITLMFDNLTHIINDNTNFKLISQTDLLKFNFIYKNGFYYVSRDIINAIINNKLHMGDNIMPFITNIITDKNIINKILNYNSKFDLFFDKNKNLLCDLDTNVNLLIKNFLNLSIYNFKDKITKIILLQKLNNTQFFIIK